MAITDYSTLKQAILVWTKRDDLDLRVDEFINLAETAMLANSVENLKIKEFNSSADLTLSTTSRNVALPAGYLSNRDVRIVVNDIEHEMDFRTPAQMKTNELPGIPYQFTVTDQIEVNVLPSAAFVIKFQYLQGFTGLSSLNTTNDVITNYPNVYLYGCLAIAFRYAQDTEEERRYFDLFVDAIKGANKKTRQGQYGTRPRIIPRGPKP